jgi:hypothetical protein
MTGFTTLPAVLTAVGVFFAATLGQAAPFGGGSIDKAAADGHVILANCKGGGRNCVPSDPRTPKFCNPCRIDGGLGSTCKNDGPFCNSARGY